MGPSDVRGRLDLVILAVLAGGPAHGYAVIEELRRRSAGAFDLPEGSVYPALHRLERDGLLSSRWSPGPRRRRRIYRLTRRGRREFEREREEWVLLARAGRGRPPAGPGVTLDRYLAELRRTLPGDPLFRRRVLAELEGHLRESAAAVGEKEAVRRMGAPCSCRGCGVRLRPSPRRVLEPSRWPVRASSRWPGYATRDPVR